MPSPWEIARRVKTLSTDRIHTLPVLVLMPHSRCNCRCVMCDIWKANASGRELTAEDLAPQLESIKRLHVRRVVLSGGEALMHSNLWVLCEMLKQRKVKITLLSTGILLKPYAEKIIQWCDDVIVSLDGSPLVHDRIRNVPRAFDRLEEGIRRLRELEPKYRISGRCVVQKKNYFDVGGVIDSARDLGLDQISFLAADVTSEAFDHGKDWEGAGDVALTPEEARHFEMVVAAVVRSHRADFSSGFVAESPERFEGFVRHFRALNDEDSFPERICNAPWVSTVVEADGTVRPCFFHEPLGTIHEAPLMTILNSDAAVQFRKNLDTTRDPTCRRCVCTLSVQPHESV